MPRAELSVLERAEHVAEWIRLTKEKMVSDSLSETTSRGGRPGAAAEASRKLGINERQAQRAAKVDSLSDDAKAAAREVGLADNQSAMLQAAQRPAAEQAEAIRNYDPALFKPALGAIRPPIDSSVSLLSHCLRLIGGIMAKRTFESHLTCSVLEILSKSPGQCLTTTQLKYAVKKQVKTLTAGDLANSKTRNDKMIDQIVGNIVSHRRDAGNIVQAGLVDYAKLGVRTGTLTVTGKGLSYLATTCPSS